MKTTEVTAEDLSCSVIAVPPLCVLPGGMPSMVNNRKMIAFLANAGITTFTYGGNANLFHLTARELAATLDQIIDAAPADAWLLPSIGPDFGKARDQIPLIRERRFPTAMLLPGSAPSTPNGVAEGVRRLTGELGAPLVIYLKSEDYIDAEDLACLVREGLACGIKYAVPRENPLVDEYLKAVIASCGSERLISGFGERPAIDHWRGFGIRSFTSGLVCIAPHLSMAMLAALKGERYQEAEAIQAQFLPLDQLRDQHSPICVLHAAVAAAKIADTGPLTPLLSSIEDDEVLARVSDETFALRRADLKAIGTPELTEGSRL